MTDTQTTALHIIRRLFFVISYPQLKIPPGKKDIGFSSFYYKIIIFASAIIINTKDMYREVKL